MKIAKTTAALAILLTLTVYAALHRVMAVNERLAEPLSSLQIASSVPDGRVLKLLSLGHNEAMADLVWLNALSFYGRYFYLETDVTWLDPHIAAIVELDPRFRLVFEWAGAVIMYSGDIDNESVMAANRVLELGVERFPFDWSLRFMLGVNYGFELVPTNEEELALLPQWREFGAEQIAIAAGLPNAPTNLHLAAASMLRARAGWDRQVSNYMQSYLSTGANQARPMRRHIEDTMLPLDAEALVRRRHLVNLIIHRPTWGMQPENFPLVLHPDPIHLFDPAELGPPPFELTQ